MTMVRKDLVRRNYQEEDADVSSIKSSGRGHNPNSQIHPSHPCRDVLSVSGLASGHASVLVVVVETSIVVVVFFLMVVVTVIEDLIIFLVL